MATKDKIVNLEDLKVLSDHVEGEVTDLKSDLGVQEPTWVDGYAIQSTSGAPVSADGHSYATLAVVEGCSVRGYTRGGAGTSRGCAFYDANGNYISGEINSQSSTYDWNYNIIVPPKATTFKITCNTNYKNQFSFAMSNLANGLIEARNQINVNTEDIANAFSNYEKKNIIKGVLFASISSTSVSSESTAKNQISFYFPVISGQVYTIDKKITTALMRIAFCENEPTYLTPVTNYENLGATGTYKTITAPITGWAVVYVYNRTNDGNEKYTPILDGTVAYLYGYVPNVEQDSAELTSVINTRHIFYCGQTRKYKKLKDAVEAAEKYMDSILYVDAGTYDLVEEFGAEWFEALTASSTLSGIVLKNRIHVVFSPNSKVISHYEGDNQYACSLYSPFNAGEYGFKITNLNLSCSRCRYGIHDERNGNSELYCSEYYACNIYIDNSNNPYWTVNHCIGGGLGTNAIVNIHHSIFDTVDNASRSAVYWHIPNNGSNNYRSRVIIDNNFFVSGTVTLDDVSATPESVADNSEYIITNNSFPQKYAGTDSQGVFNGLTKSYNLRDWNNVIRT